MKDKIKSVVQEVYGKKEITREQYDILLTGVRTGDKNMKLASARALSRFRNKDDFKYIINLLNMNTDSLLLPEAIAEYGDYAIDKIEELLKSDKSKENFYIRYNILRVYHLVALKLEHKKVEDVFLEYLNDSIANIRIVCLSGLERINSVKAIDYIENLILSEKDENVKYLAKKVIRCISENIKSSEESN